MRTALLQSSFVTDSPDILVNRGFRRFLGNLCHPTKEEEEKELKQGIPNVRIM